MRSTITEQIAITSGQIDIKCVFDIYYSRLVYFSFQLLNDKSQAQDVAQDAFVKLWDNCESISDDPIAIKNFLYSTCKNASLNIIRHNKVTEQHINRQPTNPVEEAVITNIIRTEVLAEIHQAIKLLPNGCQQIFRLCYLDGMKNSQIADLLGISVNTVKTQKQRALKTLRLQLSPELFVIILAVLPQLHKYL